MKQKVEDKINFLKERLEFYKGFIHGGRVWIQPTNGLTLREEIEKVEYQLEVLEELIEDE